MRRGDYSNPSKYFVSNQRELKSVFQTRVHVYFQCIICHFASLIEFDFHLLQLEIHLPMTEFNTRYNALHIIINSADGKA
jgi:hypothetical protein